MPSPRRRTLLLSTLAVLALATAVYAWLRVSGLHDQLIDQQRSLGSGAEQLAQYQRFAALDSLFFSGRYEAVAKRLDELEEQGAVSDDFAQRLQQRRSFLQTLRAQERELGDLRELAERDPLVSAALDVDESVEPLDALSAKGGEVAQGRYDSIRFQLEKARMQIRSLEGRLQERSGGHYLTFSSEQGNEVYYVGEVRNGQAHGQGVALLSSGSRYSGEWRNNRRHGYGTFHWPDGAYYEGNYDNDQRSGQGTYHFPDGQIFVGDWEQDLRNGEGTLYDADGDLVVRGRWQRDELIDQK